MSTSNVAQATPECSPAELKERRQWCRWIAEVDRQTGDIKKIPIAADGGVFRTNDASTFSTFDEASAGGDDRIAFVITADDPYCGIDLDNCLDEQGDVRQWAKPIVSRLINVSYGEISPSGKGIKFITRATKPDGARCVKKFPGKKQQLECYDFSRFWTITGNIYFDSKEIGAGQEAIDWIAEEFLGVAPPSPAEAASAVIPDDDDRTIYIDESWELNDDGYYDGYNLCTINHDGTLTPFNAAAYPALAESSLSGVERRCRRYAEAAELPGEGDRNNSLFRLAGSLFAIADHDGRRASEDFIGALLRDWNARLPEPLSDAEVERTIRSAEHNGTRPDPKLPKTSETSHCDFESIVAIESRVDDFPVIDGGEFWDAEYEAEYLIDGLIAANQPTILAGPSKSLKTNISIAISVSIATGCDFMNLFSCGTPRRVLFMSAESGHRAIQSSLRRIAGANNLGRDDIAGRWKFAAWVPHATIPERYQAFVEALDQHEPEVVFIDPVYQATNGEDSANVQKMGQQYDLLSRAALDRGVTPIFVHHTRKRAPNVLARQPLELEDMQGAGVAEYFRQWILVNRRSRYEAGKLHELWLCGGGSEGHSFEHALDVDEHGDGRSLRGWNATLRDPDDVMEEMAGRKEVAKQKATDAKVGLCVIAIAKAYVHDSHNLLSRSGIEKLPRPLGKNKPTDEAICELLNAGVLTVTEGVNRGRHGILEFDQMDDDQKVRLGAQVRDYYRFDADAYRDFYNALPPRDDA